MRALAELLFPMRCAACSRPGSLACADCLRPLTGGARLAWPRPSPSGLPPPYAVASYDGPTRELLLAYKEKGVSGLRAPLGIALADAVAAAAAPDLPLCLVPVPSSPRARRQRGADVVLDLARRAASELRRRGRPVEVVSLVRHRRRVADSAGLTALDRARNLAGAFAVRPAAAARFAGRTTIVVDDLITTGTTLAECAAALRAAGLTVPATATIAATRRRRD